MFITIVFVLLYLKEEYELLLLLLTILYLWK